MTTDANAAGPVADLDTLLEETPAAAQARAAVAWDRAVAGRPLILYGAGGVGRRILAVLRSHDLKPVAFADRGLAAKAETLDGLPVLTPEAAAKTFGRDAAFVVTIFNYRYPNAGAQKALADLGCACVESFAPLAWKYASELLPNYGLDLPHKTLEAASRVRAAFALMGDVASQQEYVDQVRWRLTADFAPLRPPVTGPAYFPADLVRLRSDEAFVDCGAYDGDTVRSFLKQSGGNFRRLVAIEPDPVNFDHLTQCVAALPAPIRGKVELVKAATSDVRGTARFCANGLSSAGLATDGEIEVECRTLDEILGPNPATFIKMDIEGAEPSALRGAAGLLARDRPVLAVCLYHQQDHLWDIPLYLRSKLDGYRYYIRRYEPECWEVVLYAVPEERAVQGSP